jgi:hypothetical protein|tara:strand:+ start:2148 stop:2552 length:405 start_codon:yes stop_codon:yes gene_type:complete
MKIEVSNGEILDKYSILEIKLAKITDKAKLTNILNEYTELTPNVTRMFAEADIKGNLSKLEDLYKDLLDINKTLWNIEDFIRECERNETFGSDFIELARSVYYTNDDRAETKKLINTLTGSLLVEEKSYEDYKA